MRKAVLEKGLDLADFPVLSWNPSDIAVGGQVHPPQTKMPPVRGVVLPPSDKKETVLAEASAPSALVKRAATVEVKEENKRQRLSKLPAGGDSVFIIPPGHKFVELFTNSHGTHYSVFNPAEDDEEDD